MDKQPTAVTFGRFNLLHIGHLDLFRRMAGHGGKVVIGISTAPANLPVDARVEIITKALENDKMNVEIIGGHQPFEIFATLPSDTIAYFGVDQAKLADSASRAYGWQHQLVQRLTSSTSIRKAIDAEDWDLVAQWVPGNILRDVINMHLYQGTRNAEVQAN
jgi:cytidyltransferase-like protein